jgi:hypothetical protein
MRVIPDLPTIVAEGDSTHRLPFDLYSHPNDPQIVPASQPANLVNAATLPRTFYSLVQIRLSRDTHLFT